jgi:hypothetical protein
MDNCHVRVINSEGYFGSRSLNDPGDPLSGLLLRFDVFKDENVIFQQVGCISEHKQFVVVNNRANSSRYIGYHCKIELVVPPRSVLPTLILTATGSNVSYVRAGPIDDDVKNFTDFSFGPNSLRMYGNNMQATFKGIQKVKHVVYEATNGLLNMENVNFVTAKLNSTFADMQNIFRDPEMTFAFHFFKAQLHQNVIQYHFIRHWLSIRLINVRKVSTAAIS